MDKINLKWLHLKMHMKMTTGDDDIVPEMYRYKLRITKCFYIFFAFESKIQIYADDSYRYSANPDV